MILWAIIIVSVLILLYLIGYLFFVKPATFCRKEIWPVYVWREHPLRAQEFWLSIYAPVHWIDFRIRKRLWQPAHPGEFRGRFYYRPGLTTIEDWGRTKDEAGAMEMSSAEAGNDECLRTNDE